jgi:hypothetical protein
MWRRVLESSSVKTLTLAFAALAARCSWRSRFGEARE